MWRSLPGDWAGNEERLLWIIINLFGEVWEIMSLPCRGCKSSRSIKNTYSDILPGFKLALNCFICFCLVFFFVHIFKLFIGLARLYGAGYWTAGQRDEFVLSAGRGRTQLTTNVCFGGKQLSGAFGRCSKITPWYRETFAEIMFLETNKGGEGESACHCFISLALQWFYCHSEEVA